MCSARAPAERAHREHPQRPRRSLRQRGLLRLHPCSGQRVRLMSLTPRAAGKLMLYPRHNFQIGREAHANVGSCVSAYSCDHGSHGRLWCACFSSKGALCVRCKAPPPLVRNPGSALSESGTRQRTARRRAVHVHVLFLGKTKTREKGKTLRPQQELGTPPTAAPRFLVPTGESYPLSPFYPKSPPLPS